MDKYILNAIPAHEINLVYNSHMELNQKIGCIGYMRMDFGSGGNDFWHTWFECSELNTQAFKDDFQNVIDTLRVSLLKNLSSLSSYCHKNPGMKLNDWKGEYYGFFIKTENYAYYFRCSLIKGDYNLYCYAYERGKLEKAFPPHDNIVGELKNKLENAARYIIETSAQETTSGNYITYTGDIPEEIISPKLFSKHIQDIAGIVQEYEAVLDIIVGDGSIDVVMGLDYCPNFEPDADERDEYPDDREILDPLKTRRTFESGKEILKAAEQKYGINSYEYEYIKNELTLSLERYGEVLGNVGIELNRRGFTLKNCDYTVQDYLNDYLDNVDAHPLASDNKRIADYIIDRENRTFSRPAAKPSLMDKVESGKQKAAQQEKPDIKNKKKQEAFP